MARPDPRRALIATIPQVLRATPAGRPRIGATPERLMSFSRAGFFFIKKAKYDNIIFMIDRETVEKLAKLTRVEISEGEKDSMVADLESILGYVSELSNAEGLNADGVLYENRNRFREDEGGGEPGIYTDKILADAPRTEDGYILVKQVIGEKGALDSIR